jgi:hypothetical protein
LAWLLVLRTLERWDSFLHVESWWSMPHAELANVGIEVIQWYTVFIVF